MKERYDRALLRTAPKMAAQVPGGKVEGYWLDESRYCFAAERFEPSLGYISAVPAIAHADSGRVEELISPQALAQSLSAYIGRTVELAALASAEIDLRDPGTLFVSLQGNDYWIDLRQRRVLETKPSLGVPGLYSPDGRQVCFVRGHDLWVKNRETGAEHALTRDGRAHDCYAQQPESCWGALAYRQQPIPLGLWSPDSKWFLTHRIDERHVPEAALIEHAPSSGGRPILHSFKYSLPGDPLPMATLVAIHLASGRMVRFANVSAEVPAWSPFFCRMAWFSGRDNAWFLRVDRYAQHAELIRLDLQQETARVVLSETVASGYIDLHPILTVTPNVRTLATSNEIIWYSERDGWGHLYLYDAASGKLKNRITQGEWLVRDIVQVNEQTRTLLFLAAGLDPDTDPARRILCAIQLDGSGFRRLRACDGDVFVPRSEPCGLGQERAGRPAYAQAGVSPHGRHAIIRCSNPEQGNKTELVDLDTGACLTLAYAQPSADDPIVRHFSALAADQSTPLYGVLFLPTDFDASKRYPLVDYIYPGPQLTQQPQSYGSMNAAQAAALTELGFISMMLDSRGVPGRSRKLHQLGYGGLLEPQLADHAAVIRQLCQRHAFIDGERIGIFGHSGGGAATVRALCDYGDVFKVGVSVCGNHDSTRYGAAWSDKYRGPPDRERWAAQASAAVAQRLKGRLLLITGDMDDNVHLSHTLVLADALINANRDFDLLIVPNQGHGVLMTHGYTLRKVWDYFVRHLLGETPPEEFRIDFEPYELASVYRNMWREVRE